MSFLTLGCTLVLLNGTKLDLQEIVLYSNCIEIFSGKAFIL